MNIHTVTYIDQYINNELSSIEADIFEKRLRADAEFKTNYENHLNLIEGMRRANIKAEILKAKNLINEKKYDEAFKHLEIAHVVGQRSVKLHTISHIYMLRIGFLKKDIKEILGQLVRLPLGVIGSFIGIIPTGNTGGSNVSAFKKMEIPPELEKIINE